MKRNRLLDAEFYYGTTPEILLRASQLRRNMTTAEKALWAKLKAKKSGFTFRRQHPINFYIADFYCDKARLAIEVDGSIHDIISVRLRDQGREDEFEKYGILTLRFTNDEVIGNLDKIVEDIRSTCLRRIHEENLKIGPTIPFQI